MNAASLRLCLSASDDLRALQLQLLKLGRDDLAEIVHRCGEQILEITGQIVIGQSKRGSEMQS